MASSGNDETNIRDYLLGRLPNEDREEFARRFFTDEELFEKLQAAEDDLIDDFLSGSLSQDDVAMFQQNFLVGSKRERELRVGKAWRNYAAAHAGEKLPRKGPVSSWWQWFSPNALKFGTVAALIVVTVVGVLVIRSSEVENGLSALNAAYKQERPLQSRITQLDYAPYDATRGSSAGNVDQNELNEAELTLQRIVNKKPTPEAHHALGKVFLAKREFDKAVGQFELALKGDSNNAQIYADLGAALLEKGKLEIDRAESDSAESGKGVDYFARSLTNLNRALQLDENLLAALYNRALLHESMKSLPQAEDDWRKYLDKDRHSEWAGEARQNLTRVEQERKKTSETREEILQKFLSQFNSGDEEAGWTTVSDFQNRSGNVVVEQLIDAYLEAATAQNRKEDSDRAIQRLAYVGDLQIRKSGDRFFFDLSRFYASANIKQRELVLKARELMKKGYAGWSKVGWDESLRLFENARNLYEQAGNYPEALVAEYWMSFTHYHKDTIAQSRQILTPLLLTFEMRHYLWLQVRGHYLLSSIEYKENEHSKAVDSCLWSAGLATRINDSVGLLNATGALIEYYRYLGSNAKALTWIQRGLPLLSSSRDSFQVIRYYGLSAKAFATFGLHDAAIGYQREAMRFALNTGSDLSQSQNYAFLGAIQGQLKDFDEALKNVQRAYDLAQTHADQNLMAYSALQMGHIYRDAKKFDKAVARYTESINLYRTLPKFQTHLYQAHKGRFLCYLQQQNDHLAHAEISILFDLINKYRSQISGEEYRNTFFDVEQTVVDAAIDFEYSRMNNPQQAFDYSNSARARSLLDRLNTDAGSVEDADTTFKAVSEPQPLETIKMELPDQTQLVQYEVLENKLLIYVISRNDFQVRMQPISRNDLNEKLLRFLTLISRPPKDDGSQELLLAEELYKILIQPVETLLDKQKLLCIVPASTLSYLPFAALVSPSGRYLLEDHRLITSPSASVFLMSSKKGSEKAGPKEENVLTVGNPTFDRTAFPRLDDLPEAKSEAVEVGRRYKSRVVLSEHLATVAAVKKNIGTSDVAHLALHSIVDDEVPLRSKLLLARTRKTSTGDQVADSLLHAYEIYNLKLANTRLVVLSSCESGAGRYYGGEGVSSLARAFMSAGVPLVVASLWPVETAATEKLMVNFHSHRTQERISTVDALRKAQHQMARGADGNLRRPYYWAAFTVTGGYAEF